MTTEQVIYRYGNGTTETKTRIRAAEGKAVTLDGVTLWGSIDVDSTDGWYEVDDPNDTDATDSDILEAIGGAL